LSETRDCVNNSFPVCNFLQFKIVLPFRLGA
jgi:hypothetical protein